MDPITVKLAVTVIDILLTKGVPAFFKFTEGLKQRDPVTIEDIEAVKGELDSADYFK